MNIDEILERIKSKGIKKIECRILEYIIWNTSNSEEVKFVVNKLENLGVIFKEKEYILILSFIDDYIYTKEVLEKLRSYKIKKKLKSPIKTSIYIYLIQTTDTLEEAEYVISEMKKHYVNIPDVMYMLLIEKQKDYKNALRIFKNYVLSSDHQRDRVRRMENGDLDIPLREIYGILYTKAKDNDEKNEIINELKHFKMSMDINDYNYLKEKSSIRRVLLMRKSLNEQINSEYFSKAVDNFFSEETKTSILTVDGKNNKIEKVLSVYKRNRNLVEELKRLHDNKCQICGQKLNLGDRFYSEVHHIHPLHLKGPDITENMIVLCPNHHILFDKGAISLELNMLNKANIKYIDGIEEEIWLSEDHRISQEYIDFHNKNIFMKIGKNNDTETIYNHHNVTFSSNIILINTETKEEIELNIEENKEELSFLGFQLLEKKIGDTITIDNCNFLISEIN